MAEDSQPHPSSHIPKERWEQVHRLFQSVLERRPEERREFLRQICESDMTLLREVESLLSAHEQARDFLERPPSGVDPKKLGLRTRGLLVGRKVGPYQLISFLGSGGMGEVYRARDTKLKRDVAIKIFPE